VDRHTRVVTDFVSFRAGSRESFARPLCTLMPEIDVPRCSETRPFFHLRKHPERRAAAELSLAPAVPAARSRRRPPERTRRRPPERSRRMPGLYVCAVAHTPFLSALSAGSGPELRMTSVRGAQGIAVPLAKTTLPLIPSVWCTGPWP